MDVCGNHSVDAGSIGEKCVLNEFRHALFDIQWFGLRPLISGLVILMKKIRIVSNGLVIGGLISCPLGQ
jgi:hypothetical protein